MSHSVRSLRITLIVVTPLGRLGYLYSKRYSDENTEKKKERNSNWFLNILYILALYKVLNTLVKLRVST